MSDGEAKVVLFPGASPEVFNVVLPGNQVLKQAMHKGLTNVLVLGYNPKGDVYLASASGDIPKDHFLLIRAAHMLVESNFVNSGPTDEPPLQDEGDDCA